MQYIISALCTIVAITFALLCVLGLALPKSRARQIINIMGDGMLA